MKRTCFSRQALAATLAILMLAGLLAMPMGASESAETPLPILHVDALTERADVSPYTLGANHRHAYGGFGMYDTEKGEVYPEFLKLTDEANLGVVRYPGGTIANLFTWKDTVGPVEERRPIVLGNSYASVFPYYGLDEHMRYTEAIGAEVVYMVGEAAETPEGAADLVEYLNGIPGENKNGGVDWAQKRADNGHPEPYGVTYFEIGNEMYLANQQYWLDFPSIYGDTDRAHRYMTGDTVAITKKPARRYGTWTDNLSDGSGFQSFYTQYNPVVEDTEEVYVDGLLWTRVNSLEEAGALDRVYEFDAKTGRITFGDGDCGAIPAANAKITVSYHHAHAGFTAYYDAMKAVDPTVKIFANLPYAFNFVEGTKCDGIVYHNYFTYPSTLADADELHDAYMEMADKLTQAIDNNVSQLRERTGRQDTMAAVTEFGSINNPVIYSEDTSEYGRDEARSLSRALSFARVYMGSAKAESRIHIHQAYTAYSFGGGERLPNADFVYNSMYAPYGDDPTKFISGGTALAYSVIGNNLGDSYRNTYIENNPKTGTLAEYDTLSATASVDKETGELYLLVVNADATKDVEAVINLKGYNITGKARIQTLNGSSIDACNTPEHPNDIAITETEETFGGSAFSYTFPAHSLVAIKLCGNKEEAFEESVRETFDTDTLPPLFVTEGSASVEENALCLTDTAFVTLPLTAKKMSLDGITRIRFSLRVKEQTEARLWITLNQIGASTELLSLEDGFVQSGGKIRAVYTEDTTHELEIAVCNRSGDFILYFDGSYIGSVGKITPSGGIDSLCLTKETGEGSFTLDSLSVTHTSTEVIPEIISLKEVSLSLFAGDRAPDLPAFVWADYNLGEDRQVFVTWDLSTLAPDAFDQMGEVVLLGQVEGTDLTARAVITVIGRVESSTPPTGQTQAPPQTEPPQMGDTQTPSENETPPIGSETTPNHDQTDPPSGEEPNGFVLHPAIVIAGLALISLSLLLFCILAMIYLLRKNSKPPKNRMK